MLECYPRIFPWSYITDGMTEVIPVGRFYLSADLRVPRSSKPTEFTLVTDNPDQVEFVINDVSMGMVAPKNEFTSVYLNLFDPPALNRIIVRNGVDEPVYMLVAATYMNSGMEMVAREAYEYAGRILEKYFYLLRSPWTSFIAESIMPWAPNAFPDVRSLRIMSVKMAANTMFNNSGTQDGVTDMVSVFSSSTPHWKSAKNPELWQPDLYQPVTSADDHAGFECHVWIPNLCLSSWLTFIKLVNNAKDYYDFTQVHSTAVTVVAEGTNDDQGNGVYEQHLFDDLGAGCTVNKLIEALGCLDNIVVAVSMEFTSEIAICAYANPFDTIVEAPGIGGSYFDSGTDFDGDFGPFDSSYDIDNLTDFWVGASTKKAFDYGKCFDSSPNTASVLPANVNCCIEGPDTVIFTTMALDETTTSAATPNHPLFGGDDPGLLSNPYFNELA